VFYLERAYRDADTMVYFMAYSSGGRVLRVSNGFSGDTLIERYACHDVEPGLIPVSGDLHVSVSGDGYDAQATNDSMEVTIYDGSYTKKWDTAFTRQEGELFLDRYRRSSTEYAAMVHSGELPYSPERAVRREDWIYNTLEGRTVSKRILDHQGNVSTRQYFSYQQDRLVALSFFGTDTTPYAVDSISWNADTSEMKVVNRWVYNGDRFEYTVHFAGDSSVFRSGGETVVDHWVYDKTPWRVRFREAALREGPPCQSRIIRAEEGLLRSSYASTGDYTKNEHVWMPDGRLLETVVFSNGRFERSIEYFYP
jgi:hypothetical protein